MDVQLTLCSPSIRVDRRDPLLAIVGLEPLQRLDGGPCDRVDVAAAISGDDGAGLAGRDRDSSRRST
jgi:hypothetical protein